MSINTKQLRELVIQPVLESLEAGGIPYSEAARELLLMIAAHESKMGHYIRQVGCTDGVGAYGIYQIELATESDAWVNYINYREELATESDAWSNYINYRDNLGKSMSSFIKGIDTTKREPSRLLTCDLAYQTAIARVILYRAPEKLPEVRDYEGMAKYCKKYWNTELGKATWEDYLYAYKKYYGGGY